MNKLLKNIKRFTEWLENRSIPSQNDGMVVTQLRTIHPFIISGNVFHNPTKLFAKKKKSSPWEFVKIRTLKIIPKILQGTFTEIDFACICECM